MVPRNSGKWSSFQGLYGRSYIVPGTKYQHTTLDGNIRTASYSYYCLNALCIFAQRVVVHSAAVCTRHMHAHGNPLRDNEKV